LYVQDVEKKSGLLIVTYQPRRSPLGALWVIVSPSVP
jgi:hypothetical protein